MADTKMEKIKRSLFATFINTTPGGESETWARMGKGITSQNISYNPNVTTEQYIDEDNATSSVDSYAPSLDGTQTCYKGEPVFTYIDGLRQSRAVGPALETQVLFVYLYDGAENSFKAEKNNAVIQLGEYGGDGGGNITMTYTVGLNGNPVVGTASVAGGNVTFTAGK
jgi:hypothetical protein